MCYVLCVVNLKNGLLMSDKYHLAMSGEFFVAAELQRRGISAAVTYGNAKRADIIAFMGASNRAVVIEVKTTRNKKWVVGNSVPEKLEIPWVFVYLPEDDNKPPSFFVILQSELHDIMTSIVAEYNKNYEQRHHRPYDARNPVWDIKQTMLADRENRWDVITNLLQA
jgi:hypothetical protein